MTTNANKRRLLILTSTFPRWPGDHEPPFVFELARRLVAKFDVTVLTPAAAGALGEEIVHNVRVIRFRYAPKKLERLAYEGGIPARLRSNRWYWLLLPNFLVAQAVAIWRLLRHERFEAIHAHWIIPQGVLAVLCRLIVRPKPRLLITSHGADVFGFNNRVFRLIKRWVLVNSDTVSAVSVAIQDQLLSLAPHHKAMHVAPMGVDLKARFVPPKTRAETNTLVFAGRLVEKKGLDILLKALPGVLTARPAVTLLIVGDGPLRNAYAELARSQGVDEKVKFLGSIENPKLPDVFEKAELVVLPFRKAQGGDQEGLGLVTIEAMGCGLPVIVGDVPAVRDVVQHKRNGWIVDGADPGELCKAILLLLSDRALANQLALQGRKDVLIRFDWSVVAGNYENLLGALLTDKPDPTPL